MLCCSEWWKVVTPVTCFNHLKACMTNWRERATRQHYMSSTMHVQEPSNISSAKMTLTSKSLRSTTMPSLPMNPQSSWPSATPLPIWQPSTLISKFNFGASSFSKLRSPSTSYKSWGWIQKSQHARHSMANTLTEIKRPLAPLGSRALGFLPSAVRNMFQAHAIDTWHVSLLMNQCREMYFNNPKMGCCTSRETYTLFPAHACMPTISKDDHTIMVATDLLKFSSKLYQLVELKNETIAKCCVHSLVFLPNTNRQSKTGGHPNLCKTCHPQGWIPIEFEGKCNTNFEGGQDTNHIRWPNGARSHPHGPIYPPTTKRGSMPHYRQCKTSNTQQMYQHHLPQWTYRLPGQTY